MSALPVSLTARQIRSAQRGETLQIIRAGQRGALYHKLAAGKLVWIREQFRIDRRFDGMSASQADSQNARPSFVADENEDLIDPRGLGKVRGCRLLPRAWHRYSAHVLAVRRLQAGDLTPDDVAGESFRTVNAWAREWDRARNSFGNTDLWATNPPLLLISLQPILSPLPERGL